MVPLRRVWAPSERVSRCHYISLEKVSVIPEHPDPVRLSRIAAIVRWGIEKPVILAKTIKSYPEINGEIFRPKIVESSVWRDCEIIAGCSERGGRPTEWTAELIDKETEALYYWIQDPNNYFITSFLNLRGLHHENIERFARENEKFRAAYRLAKQIQEQRLVELAVTRKGDGGFIKFILQNKAGWKEKNEISGDVNNPLAVIMDTIGKNSRDPLEEYSEE